MELRSKVLATITAAVLTMAASEPASALENEFHGMYRVNGIVSNFENGGVDFYNPAGKDRDTSSSTYVEQRIRLKYNAKLSNDFKLVTDFKIDSIWGRGAYDTKRKLGGGIGSDTVNLETRAAYVDFNVFDAQKVKLKVGIQPWTDAYDGIFVDTQMAGVVAATKVNGLDLSLGWFRLDDSASTPFGHDPRDLVLLEAAYALGENLLVGGSYYMLNDDATSNTNYLAGSPRTIPTETVHTLGVNSQAKFGIAAVNGFFLYQFGDLKELGAGTERNISAFAAGAGAKAKFGFGTLKGSFLYASGDKNSGGSKAFRDVEDLDGGTETDYSSDMRILRKDMFSGPSGNALVATINNKDQGLLFGSVGCDVDISPKLAAGANVGFAAVAERNANSAANLNPGAANSSKYLGTEINAALSYKLNPNVTVRLREAYAFLGDYYKGTALRGETPKNLFLTNLMMTYAF